MSYFTKTPYYLIVSVLLIINACKQVDKQEQIISEMSLELEINRFDREFMEAGAEGLAGLKVKYPFLFPSQYPDSIWLAKMSDTLQLEISSEVDSVFPDFQKEEAELTLLLKHIKHYFPETTVPGVITLTTEVDHSNRIILADTLLLIGLDNYLGKDHRFYGGIDRYLAQFLGKDYLTGDVASAFANKLIPYPSERTFLARLVYHGKLLYLKEKWMPTSTDGEIIQYSAEQLAWAEANEEQIWRYFIERELLYSTDQGLNPRFLDPAPFSKFRLELDSESPGRLGRYIGWQIVRSYMENNETSLQDLLALSGDEIFKNSRYKPNK